MSWCDAGTDDAGVTRCLRADAGRAGWVGDSEAHTFSGYGFIVHYHPECCPGEVDGTRCRRDHPQGWLNGERPTLTAHLSSDGWFWRAAIRGVLGHSGAEHYPTAEEALAEGRVRYPNALEQR